MFLVLIETAGNQDYIFSTNKLRENIGASQLTYEAGTCFVLAAVHHLGGPDLLVLRDGLIDTAATEERLRNNKINRPLVESGTIEVVYATSGKALLLVDSRDRAKSAVSAVTSLALAKAPGLDLCGAVLEMNWHTDRIDKSVRSVHEELERTRERRPGPRTRFARLPVVAQCASSGLPAATFDVETKGGPERPLSSVCMAKREAFPRWTRRINDVLRRHETTRNTRLPDNPDALEQWFGDLRWTAVVHCDANGLGGLFQTLHEHVWDTRTAPRDWSDNNASYVDTLRRLSIEIEKATEAAFATAVATLPASSQGPDWMPVVPVLLGGDDFTVMCDGQRALPFTEAYLAAFESATAKEDGLISYMRAEQGGRLSASGGVAITKPHFPFHLAYDLAEELTASAKVVKDKVKVPGAACSALDFHILFDSTFVDLESIRERLLADAGTTRLTRKPYVTTDGKDLGEHASPWTVAHTISGLEARIEKLAVLLGQDDDGLPNSQLHDLREALFQGRDAADSRLGLIRHRYKDLDALTEGDGSSLFAPTEDKPFTHDTQLLDVLETEPFWRK